MEVFIYGLARGSTLALMAVGFSFAYGVSRLPNFAHGAFYILAGFATWVFAQSLGLNYVLSIAISLVLLAAIGAAMYRFILIRVRGMEVSEIIASYALGVAILEALRCKFVGTGFSTPVFIEGTIKVAGVPIDLQRVVIIAGGVVVIGLIWAFTHYTRLGLSLRGIAQDERAALMLGIDSDRAATIALAIGSALAALAAVIILPVGSITVNEGYDVLISALAVCIIGGLGSWTGTILAAFILGFAGTLTATYIGTMWESVVVVAAIILVLLLKPSGLFGRQKEFEERV
ncbi:MAG: branched-chain amino acid ABC transporter permease [Dehalococcoidia bacterium]|nr:branched-chain amino acid ABC transporter permease [Dehalococcoidia bacterium]